MIRNISIVLLLELLFSNTLSNTRPVNTYSIVAYDDSTGQLGVAVQSHWFSVGSLVPWAKAGVGAVATQSLVKVEYGPDGLKGMEEGKLPHAILSELLDEDDGRDLRQVAMIDAYGNVSSHTGQKCISYAGHQIGKNYSVQANIMEKPTVWPAMAKAFEKTKGDLANRMMAALEAAEKEGGDLRGKQSASMLIVSGEPTGIPWKDVVMDLRIDDHPTPLKELKRLIRIHRAYRHANKGDHYLELEKIDKAMIEYGKASQFYPENPELPYWSAVTLAGAGDLKKALPIFKDVFKKESKLRELTPRLVNAGILPNSNDLIEKIIQAGDRIAHDDDFRIELINHRDYPIYRSKSGDINVNASDTQLHFKVRGLTSVDKTERIDWKTKNAFRWNDGTPSKDFPVINSFTYTFNGVGESNIGLLPEMKGSSVIIYGHYQDQVDSLRIYIQ